MQRLIEEQWDNTILNVQATEDLKNGKITEFVNKELDECRELCEEKYNINADVYFSRLK